MTETISVSIPFMDLNGIHFTFAGLATFAGGIWAITRVVASVAQWALWRSAIERKVELLHQQSRGGMDRDTFERLWSDI